MLTALIISLIFTVSSIHSTKKGIEIGQRMNQETLKISEKQDTEILQTVSIENIP